MDFYKVTPRNSFKGSVDPQTAYDYERMVLMKKALLCMAVALCLVLSMSVVALAVDIDTSRDIDELRSIVQELIYQRDAADPLGAASRLPENLHLHPGFADAIFVCEGHYNDILFGRNARELRYYDALEANFDARFALMLEFRDLITEALVAQNRSNGVETNYHVLSTWAGPQPGHNMFSITFFCDTFLPLVDVILDFVGIPEYMLEVQESAMFSLPSLFPCQFQSQMYSSLPYEVGYLDDTINASRGLLMGTRIYFTLGDWTSTPGTLGHPLNGTGRVAFSTSHGIIPVNAIVEDSRGTRLGVVSTSTFAPHIGVDVSRIVLDSGFHMLSSMQGVPGVPSMPATWITNFNSPPPERYFPVRFIGTMSGPRAGEIVSPRTWVDIRCPRGVLRVWSNIIETWGLNTVDGDSGGALFYGTRVIGTLIGGHEGRSFFSRVAYYINIGATYW